MRWNVLYDGLGTIVLGSLAGAALCPLILHRWMRPFYEMAPVNAPWPRVRAYCLAMVGVFAAWFVLHSIVGLV